LIAANRNNNPDNRNNNIGFRLLNKHAAGFDPSTDGLRAPMCPDARPARVISRTNSAGAAARHLYAEPCDRERFLDTIKETGSVQDFETRFRRRDGAILDVRITATTRRNGKGQVEGYEGFVLDVTDRKRVERALQDSEEKYRAGAGGRGPGSLYEPDCRYPLRQPEDRGKTPHQPDEQAERP
jgi:hypothetical protein